MSGLSKIMHPTDFSDCSQSALHFASNLAERLGAKLLITHVRTPDLPVTAAAGGMVGSGYAPAASMLSDQVDEAHESAIRDQLHAVEPSSAKVVCEYLLLEGDPATEIAQQAKEEQVDQIVLGSHGRKGLSRLLMGSVAESILREAPCPVTIVKPHESN